MKDNFFLKQKIPLFLLIIIFVSIIALIMVNKMVNKRKVIQKKTVSTSNVSGKSEVSFFQQKKGKVNLIFKNKTDRFTIDQPMRLIILVDSKGKNITGFDFIIAYDKTAFSFNEAVSLSSDFDLKVFQIGDGLIVTGNKKLEVNQPIILNNSQLIELVFLPKKVGQFDFSILSSKEKEKTQMVDINSQVFYPEVNSLKVYVN
jgi:hypothetical protein